MPFVIEDEIHAEQIGEFASRKDAIVELRRLAGIAWDQPPNLAPCTGWQICGRRYEIIEYNGDETPWREIDRIPAMAISAEGVVWESGFGPGESA